MPERKNYLKALIEMADKASKTYVKFQEYQISPEKLKEDDPNLYSIIKFTEGMVGNVKLLLNKENETQYQDSSYSTSDNYSGNTRENYYKVLDCTTSDSNEVIKANYKKMVKKFHPDSISGKDLPEEFIEFSNQKFKEIQEAYEYIKMERNF